VVDRFPHRHGDLAVCHDGFVWRREPDDAVVRDRVPYIGRRAGSTCQATPGGPSSPVSAIFFVTGFSSKVADPAAPPPLEARVRVGERIKMTLQLQGCGSHTAEAWSTGDTRVGTVTQGPAFSSNAEFLAMGAGTTTIFVDFTAMDDKRHRTGLGYCPLDTLYPGYPSLGVCNNPKFIGTVRVVE
jgi:hypothetical protein